MPAEPRAKLARDIFSGILGHAAVVLTGLLITPLIARMLGAEALGAWAILGTLTIILLLSDLGLTAVVQRAAVGGDRERLFRAVELALLVVCVVAPPLAAICYLTLGDLSGAPPSLQLQLPRAALATLGAGVLGVLIAPHRGFVIARGGMVALARARGICSVVHVTATWVGLLIHPSLVVPALALLLAQAIEVGIIVAAARGLEPQIPLRPRLPASWRDVRTALRDGSAVLVINVSCAAALRIDVLILSQVASLAVVGAYGVASRAIDQLQTLAKQASAALLPRLGDPARRAGAVALGTHLLGITIAAGMAAVAINGQPILVAWAGPVAAGPVTATALALLGSAAVLAAVTEPISSMLTLGSRSVWVAAIPIVTGAAVNVAVSIAGASRFGVWAVAGGTVAGNAVTLLLAWGPGRKLLGLTRAQVLRIFVPAFIAGAVAIAVSAMLDGVAARGLVASVAVVTAATAAGCAAGMVVVVRTAAPDAPPEPEAASPP